MRQSGEQGFMLVGLIVACFLVLLALSVAAPTVAYQMRREREVETEQRANQYVRAIRLYYRKFGHYPGSMEQLEKTNNVRYLRQRYIDPMTGKDDWRLIAVGQNKTTVKGFFGQPLAGLPTQGIGSSMPQSQMGSGIGTTAGGSGAVGAVGTGGIGGSGGTGTASGATGTANGAGTTAGSSSSTGTSGTSSGLGLSTSNMGPGLSTSGSTGPFMGVGLVREGNSILDINDQTTYNTWEFLYDPRSEPKPNLGGGGSSGSLGSSNLNNLNGGMNGAGSGTGTAGSGTMGSGTTGGTTGTGTGATPQ